MTPEPIAIALRVARAFESCGIRYLVGGSLASSISGEPRSTLDVDMVVELKAEDIDRFVAALGSEFHADRESIRRAVFEKSSANLIHFGTSIKVDLFIAGGTPLDASQLDRRVRARVATDPEAHLYVYAPEDILLQKLRWYQLGGETSDRQWRDIMGIVRVQGEALDINYLRNASSALGVETLLERALDEGRPG